MRAALEIARGTHGRLQDAAGKQQDKHCKMMGGGLDVVEEIEEGGRGGDGRRQIARSEKICFY